MSQLLLILLLLCARPGTGEVRDAIHISTALDHLTLLQFNQPVTQVAVGSSSFQVERHGNSVFIKPLKPGAATNLFVWTASARYSYELDPPGEPANMTFAMDHEAPAQSSAPAPGPNPDQAEQKMLADAFLRARPVDSTRVRVHRDRVNIRIDHILGSGDTLYVHYSIQNYSSRGLHLSTPTVIVSEAPHTRTSLAALELTQVDADTLRRFGPLRSRPLWPVAADCQKADLLPGESTEGFIAIGERPAGESILEISFKAAPHASLEAAMVL